MFRLSFYIVFSSVFLFSCGKYQKVLKSNDYEFKLAQAKVYYEKEDFNKAMPLFNELSSILRGTDKAEEVDYYYAYCNYSIGENLMAAYLFDRFFKTYTKSEYREESAYMIAFCYYLEAPIYSLDSKNTNKAIKQLQTFINQYPSSDRVEECNKLIDELRLKLSEKAFQNAKQYYTTEHYKSSIIALSNVLIDFPDTDKREEIRFLILDSSYLLAINSISIKKQERLEEVLELYEMFVDNYNDSIFLKEVKDIKQKTDKLLIQLKELQNEI